MHLLSCVSVPLLLDPTMLHVQTALQLQLQSWDMRTSSALREMQRYLHAALLTRHKADVCSHGSQSAALLTVLTAHVQTLKNVLPGHAMQQSDTAHDSPV